MVMVNAHIFYYFTNEFNRVTSKIKYSLNTTIQNLKIPENKF